MRLIKSQSYVLAAKKKKKTFEYEGEKYDTNPFAVCHTTVDKKEDPDKYERCVMDVKDKSKKD
jgi:hypothetical protein